MTLTSVRAVRVEGGRVNHSWCICVASYGYGGFGGGGVEMVVGNHAGQSLVGVGCMLEHFMSAR